MRSLFLVTLLALPASAQSDPYQLIPFRGTLLQGGHTFSTQVSLQFSLYAQEKSKGVLYCETVPAQPASDGTFSVMLGQAGVSGTCDSPTGSLYIGDVVAANPTLWVGIAIEAPGSSLYELLSGRQQLLAAPLATRAESVADGVAINASSVTIANNLSLGGLIQSPAMRSQCLVGVPSNTNSPAVCLPAHWATKGNFPGVGTPCPGLDCMQKDVPFQSNGGTVLITVETTGWRSAPGEGEMILILNPNAQGQGIEVGAMRLFYDAAQQHKSLPTLTAILPTSLAGQCATKPCQNILRIATLSDGTSANASDGSLLVDPNDFLRMTLTELPYVTN